MNFKVLKPGLLSTLQDMGRLFYADLAVPLSGAMDTLAARIANRALGNNDNDAVIEFTYGGAELMAEHDSLIAYSGDGGYFSAGGRKLPADRPVYLPAGTTLKLLNNNTGSRTYLSIAGGWRVTQVLKSSSTYLPASFGGMQGRVLKENDELESTGTFTPINELILEKLAGSSINYPRWSIARNLLLPENRKLIRVMQGPEYDWFDEDARKVLFSGSYKLSNNSSRIGYYLEGERIKRPVNRELLSTAVTPGTIQVTGDGTPILLMADCQTTGGYPRIAQVASVDLPLCGQLKPGDPIHFKQISLNDAEALFFKLEKELDDITQAIRLRYLHFDD